MNEFFKALSDETRLRCLVLILNHQEICVCELIYALELPQPTISRHLSILKWHKLVQQRRMGQWMLYSIHPDLSAYQRDILARLLKQAETESLFIADERTLSTMLDRPQIEGRCCHV